MPPLMLLTVHRSASSFLDRQVLDPLAADLGWARADPFGDAKSSGIRKSEVRIDPFAGRSEVVLGPVRHPKSIQDVALFDGWTKILVLRHPLDVLISFWFYITTGQGMHGVGVIGERLRANRERAIAMGRDAWMREMAVKLAERYEDYRVRFAHRPNLSLLRYEDLVSDWIGFLDRFTRSLNPQPSAAWRAEMMAHASEFAVDQESPDQHKRQISAGDHLRKLNADLINELSEQFSSTLIWLNSSNNY